MNLVSLKYYFIFEYFLIFKNKKMAASKGAIWLELGLDPKYETKFDELRKEAFPDLTFDKRTHATILYIGKYDFKQEDLDALWSIVCKSVDGFLMEDNEHLFGLKEICLGDWSPVTFAKLSRHDDDDIMEDLYRALYAKCINLGYPPQMTNCVPETRGDWHLTIQWSRENLEQTQKVFAPLIRQPVPFTSIRLVQGNSFNILKEINIH